VAELSLYVGAVFQLSKAHALLDSLAPSDDNVRQQFVAFATVLLLQMLARKFLHYQQDRQKVTGDEKEEELKGPPPASLYLLAACMTKVGYKGGGGAEGVMVSPCGVIVRGAQREARLAWDQQ
jgi:hypothetical protein